MRYAEIIEGLENDRRRHEMLARVIEGGAEACPADRVTADGHRYMASVMRAAIDVVAAAHARSVIKTI